jgi:hypothetical protein
LSSSTKEVGIKSFIIFVGFKVEQFNIAFPELFSCTKLSFSSNIAIASIAVFTKSLKF